MKHILTAIRTRVHAAADAKDTVVLDVPLFIRLLEVAREELKTDAELHDLVERVITAQKKTEGALTMTVYPQLYSK